LLPSLLGLTGHVVVLRAIGIAQGFIYRTVGIWIYTTPLQWAVSFSSGCLAAGVAPLVGVCASTARAVLSRVARRLTRGVLHPSCTVAAILWFNALQPAHPLGLTCPGSAPSC
jgi:hypothetical protein